MPSVRAEETAETADLALGRAFIQLRNAAEDGRLLVGVETESLDAWCPAAAVAHGAPSVALDRGRLLSPPLSQDGTAVVTCYCCRSPACERKMGTHDS